MFRPAQIIINLSAVKANCALVQSLCTHSKTVAVVKADAYGHGSIQVAKAIEDQVEMFAVACMEEAQVLREAGVVKPLLLLEGCFSAAEITLAVKYECELVVHNLLQVKQLIDSQVEQPLKVWLKIDSGMHRLGIMPDAAVSVFNQLIESKNVADIVVTTHFSDADNLQGLQTLLQLKTFENCIKPILDTCSRKVEQSIANSAGVLGWPDSRADWNRPGIMLYGLSPFAEPHEEADKLNPAMTFQSKVTAIREITKGESVGYGSTWTAERETIIATIAIGYGDGYPRNAKSGTPVLVNDQRARLVGRVSMDMITVDVTDLPRVNLGDNAILWGKELSANEVAHWAGTIGYELVTRMPRRVKRVFVD